MESNRGAEGINKGKHVPTRSPVQIAASSPPVPALTVQGTKTLYSSTG